MAGEYEKQHSVDSFVSADHALGEPPPLDVRFLPAFFLRPYQCTIDDTVNKSNRQRSECRLLINDLQVPEEMGGFCCPATWGTPTLILAG